MTFKVKITCDYELEVDAENKDDAIDLAMSELMANPQFDYEVEETA